MGRRKKYSDSINPKIKELYVEKNMSLNQISQTLNIHPQICKRRLQSMGIDLRNQSQAMENFHQNWRKK